MERRSFFSSFFGGAAATAVAITPAKSEVKDIDGKTALAELKPDREYLLFVDVTRVDIDSFAAVKSESGANVQIIPTIPRPGHPVADSVTLFALESAKK